MSTYVKVIQGKAAFKLMVCILFGLQYAACSADEGRTIIFQEPIPNRALEGHVISTEELPNEGSCRVKCYMEANCVSINMGPLKEGKLKCELNDATAENEFETSLKNKAAHTYLPIENPCSSNPCLNGGKCQAGFTGRGFQCRCPVGFRGIKCGRTAKSCSDIKRLDPTSASGSYVIDPDAKEGLQPFNVTCNMTDKNGVGVTVISHDSESRTRVKGCNPRGCYSRDINYTGASLSQLAGLTRVSSHCEQFIKYECHHSVLLKYLYGWWVSRNSTKMKYWGGASVNGKCACGMTNSCADPIYGCNCDKNDHVWREDSGLLTDKTHLPVQQLKFGDTGDRKEEGYHTLGKMKCYGIA